MPLQTPEFRFAAPDAGRLSPAMIRSFSESGFLVLEGFARPEACDLLRGQAHQLMQGIGPEDTSSVFSTTTDEHQADRYFMESGDKIRFFFEPGSTDESGHLVAPAEECLNKIGHAIHDLDPVFQEFSYRKELGLIARSLGHQDPSIVQSMYILKAPRIGGEVTCHQDSTYIYTDPDSCIGFWFALEDATLTNGCMSFIPGLHSEPLRERNYRTGPLTTTTELLDDRPWPLDDAIPVVAPKGSLVVFHGRAPHFSGPNRSDSSRHAYTLHVIDRACRYPEENWLRRGEDMPLRPLGV